MAAATSTEFRIASFAKSPGRDMPQNLGRMLWFPMWLMAAMGFGAGFVVAIIRANEVAGLNGAGVWSTETTAQLQHVGAGLMFIGFAAVFAAISFTIARILGEFRKGGGELQQATGRTVKVLKMPFTAKLFIGTMAMAMMALVIASILHFVFAADIDGTAASLQDAEQRFIVLEGVRRGGVVVYLLSFLLGLGTIIEVLRFQSIRIRELAGESAAS